jgi:hypothetical protein
MNHPLDPRLAALVDDALRPVRASTARKSQMREELLAHVCAVYEEEQARQGEVGDPLERTARRFGDPQELAARLHQALPAGARLAAAVELWWARCAGDGPFNHGRLYTMLLGLTIAYTLIGLVLMACLLYLPENARPRMIFPSSWLPALLALNAFYLVLMTTTLVLRLRESPSATRWTKALNWLLLAAPPFGTALGLYGLYGLWSSARRANPLIA